MNRFPIAAAFLIVALLSTAQPQEMQFQDVTEKAGIKALIIAGGKQKNYVLEVNGSGACWFDFNNDGYMDLYLVNGSTLSELQGKKPIEQHRNYLFRNNRDGTFTDVSESAHVLRQ